MTMTAIAAAVSVAMGGRVDVLTAVGVLLLAGLLVVVYDWQANRR